MQDEWLEIAHIYWLNAQILLAADGNSIVVAFLLRHAVELWLKSLLANSLTPNHFLSYKKVHSLLDLWQATELNNKNYDWDKTILILNSLDPDSVQFRYPEGKITQEHLEIEQILKLIKGLPLPW